MSVLVFADSSENKFKKTTFEAVSYGKKVAELLNTSLIVLTINGGNATELYTYGAETVVEVKNDLKIFNTKAYASIIKQVVENKGIDTVILDSSVNGLTLGAFLSVELEAGYVSNVIGEPLSTSPFVVKRKVFSNKALAHTEISTSKRIIGIAKNSFGIYEHKVDGKLESFEATLPELNVISKEINKATGKVSLADADIVVSGGRGMKGAENWGMLEELADVLGAATACSKPVSDLHWRPHSEHVGQTGKPISCNLYIAVGISGAIQHLAGVNSSKVKVVINNDKDAPFFKSADYGIVGDAFEIVPQLTEKLKEFKQH